MARTQGPMANGPWPLASGHWPLATGGVAIAQGAIATPPRRGHSEVIVLVDHDALTILVVLRIVEVVVCGANQ